MWKKIQTRFKKQKGRLNVVRKMIELGVRIDENSKLYVGDAEIDDTAIARAVGVDRRVVRSTTKQILDNSELREIFTRIRPVGASLVEVAKILDYSVLVIRSDPHRPGVIASVTSIVAKYNLVVRQALADDPDLVPEPCLTLVIDGKIPAKAIDEIRSLPLVKSLTMLK
ncbi:MAG: amino acid-binding protein [archaeon]|nr:amino acid-binding protein [archaeon]MCP8314516.1 amino acid-binding protein [archaeon]